jgi:hypothetical protein
VVGTDKDLIDVAKQTSAACGRHLLSKGGRDYPTRPQIFNFQFSINKSRPIITGRLNIAAEIYRSLNDISRPCIRAKSNTDGEKCMAIPRSRMSVRTMLLLKFLLFTISLSPFILIIVFNTTL